MDQEQSVINITVSEVESLLEYIRKNYNIEGPPINVPAHITLQYPWIEPRLITDNILIKLNEIFRDRKSFTYNLKVGWFGDEFLVLVPEDDSNFVDMTKEIVKKWPKYPYYGGEYSEIEPHITLAVGDSTILKQIYSDIVGELPKDILCSKINLDIGVSGNMKLLRSFNLKKQIIT